MTDNKFNPDWDQVEALQESLREHMAEIHRLRAALAQPDQKMKPQAWMLITEQGVCGGAFRFRYDAEVAARELGERFSLVPLYAAPLQRGWQKLTDEEINSLYETCGEDGGYEYERAIEAKLKEKNV